MRLPVPLLLVALVSPSFGRVSWSVESMPEKLDV
jgi:hypothetical protein